MWVWIYWRPRGSPFSVPLPWWLVFPQPDPNSGYVPLAPGPIEAILAMAVVAVYCYIAVAWALCYIRLGVVRGFGTVRNVVRLPVGHHHGSKQSFGRDLQAVFSARPGCRQ